MEEILKNIKAITYDIDGVMTDGSILTTSDGDLLRIYNAKDCFSVRIALLNGFEIAVITGGKSESIRYRMHDSMGIPNENIYLASRDKLRIFNEFCERTGIKPSECAYFGDDLPDIPVIRACGFGVAPADAVPEVKEAADYISPFPGGRGCIRNTVEMILKAQGKWKYDVGAYEKRF